MFTSLCSGIQFCKRVARRAAIVPDRGVFWDSFPVHSGGGRPGKEVTRGHIRLTEVEESASFVGGAYPALLLLSEVAQQTQARGRPRTHHDPISPDVEPAKPAPSQQRSVARLQGWRTGQLATTISDREGVRRWQGSWLLVNPFFSSGNYLFVACRRLWAGVGGKRAGTRWYAAGCVSRCTFRGGTAGECQGRGPAHLAPRPRG